MDFDPTIMAQVKIAVASFAGGTVRLFFRPAATLGKSVFLVFCCMICGYYSTPVIMDVWEFNESWAGAIGALMGLVGLSIAEVLLHMQWRDVIGRFVPEAKDKT